MKKRLLAMLMAVAMMLSLLPTAAFAAPPWWWGDNNSGNDSNDSGIVAKVVTSSDNTTYGKNVLKIRYEDVNGNDLTLSPDAVRTFTFGDTLSISKDTFAQPTGVIDGYVFERAYFFWSGHYSGTKKIATDFKNFGYKCRTYNYDSYLGFKVSGESSNDYSGGYYSYNPTGVLHLVYQQVTPQNPYNIYWYDGATLLDTTQAAHNNGVYTFVDTSINNPTKDGFKFAGWKDASGNTYDTGVEITSDVYMYAQWEPVSEPEPETYTVTYNANGGSGEMTDGNSPYNTCLSQIV